MDFSKEPEYPKSLDDDELNKIAEKMYINDVPESTGDWKRVIKYLVTELDVKLNESAPIHFWIANNKSIQLLQEGKYINFLAGKNLKKLVFSILRNPEMKDNYRISLSVNNKSWGCHVYLKIFIHDNHLRWLCQNYCIAPDMLSTVVNDKGNKKHFSTVTTTDIPIAKNCVINDTSSESYLNKLKITPYMYQKNNVEWMFNMEKNVDIKQNEISYLIIKNLIGYKLGDREIYMDPESNILYDEESLWNYKKSFQTVKFKGGVLCDEAGLGKTLTVVSLILKNPSRKLICESTPSTQVVSPDTVITKKKVVIAKKKVDTNPEANVQEPTPKPVKIVKKKTIDEVVPEPVKTSVTISDTKLNVPVGVKSTSTKTPAENKYTSHGTIILCPSRLCQQWEDEILKYTKPEIYSQLSIIKITTKPQFEKQTYKSLCNADVVIVSYPFIANKSYSSQDNMFLQNIHWHRVVIDEGHEVLLPNSRRKAEVQTCTTILELPSTYRWVCTGDPLARTHESFEGIIAFLSGDKDIDYGKDSLITNMSESVSKQIVSTYFRRNTKVSTKDQIYIPGVKENITFLEFSPTERAVYDAAKVTNDTTRMMQLCTNILISDHDANIIGNRTVNMNEINEAMSEHFKILAADLKGKIADNVTAEAQLEKDFPIELKNIEDQIQPFQDMKKKKLILTTIQEDELEALKDIRTKLKASYNYKKKAFAEKNAQLETELAHAYEQIKLFTGLNTSGLGNEPCPICQEPFKEIVITKCGHIFCHECFSILFVNATKYANCPFCREHMLITDIKKAQLDSENTNASIEQPDKKIVEKNQNSEILNKWGVKMAHLVKYLNEVFLDPSHRVIIFSQWNRMLNMVGNVLDEANINHVYCRGNVWTITKSITKFKRDPTIRVIMLSSETCSSGSNLTEATHVILLDTANTSKENALAIENQAVARAARLGQLKSVQVVRMVIKNTIEEEYYNRNYLSAKDPVAEPVA